MSESLFGTRKVAFRQGLTFSAILIVLNFFLLLFFQLIIRPWLLLKTSPFIFNLVNYGPSLLLYGTTFLLAGLLASRQTGQFTTGLFACLWANLWFLIGHLLLILLFNGLPLLAAAQASGRLTSVFAAFVLTTLVSSSRLFTILSLVIGTGLGALGGLFGRALACQKAKVGA